jgi:hypothetical protein
MATATATLTSARLREHGGRNVRPDPELPHEIPPVTTVFRGRNWALFHTRCRRPIQFQGTRGGELEGDFYCLACQEHVTLASYMLDRIPFVAEA